MNHFSRLEAALVTLILCLLAYAALPIIGIGRSEAKGDVMSAEDPSIFTHIVPVVVWATGAVCAVFVVAGIYDRILDWRIKRRKGR